MRASAPAGLALSLLVVGLAGCGLNDPNSPAARTCSIASGAGFVPLDPDVDNLETCAARLEVVFLKRQTPVTGRYGGVFVYVTAQSIDAAKPNGPRERLLDPKTRAGVDDQIRQLLKAG